MSDWQSAEIISVSPLSPRVREVVIQAAENFVWGPGQHVQVKPHVEGEAASYYSIASWTDPARPGRLELSVGNVSSRLRDARPQTPVLLKGPAGGLKSQMLRSASTLVLIGMGTGVAPLRSTIQWAGRQTNNYRLILLAAHRTVHDLLYHDEFRGTIGLDYRPILSQGLGYEGRVGHVQEHLQDLPVEGSLFYVCGSKQMTTSVAEILDTRGAHPDLIFCEGY
jgi:NAD(P)H-flavin reductase